MKKILIKEDKKGQVGDTTTWVVATLIIIFILFTAIFSLKLFGWSSGGKNIRFSYSDLIIQKSAEAFLLTKNSQGQKIFDVLKNSDNLDEESNALANTIFLDNKDEYYWKIGFGIGNAGNFKWHIFCQS